MTPPPTSAEAVLHAAAAVRRLNGRAVVVKLGGSAMEEPAATRGTLECVAVLHKLGAKLVLVHGGGKPIDRAMDAAGIKPVKVQGRRYTDDATLEIVVRVLCEINRNLVTELTKPHFVSAIGFNDPLHSPVFPVAATRLLLPGLDPQPIDLGHVGHPHHIDLYPFNKWLRDGWVPVLPSLARDHLDESKWLNINADTLAGAVAGALKCEHCLFLTDTPGVLADRDNPLSLFPKLTVEQCRDLIASGVIAGGMIPKVEACFDALAAGAGRAVILDGRRPHALLQWLLGEPVGTAIVPA